ncbi:MAG: hypothetical protein HZB38_01340 [Planctomycetes bacterium]|nr:hypothetical protein [Planctomycetota bacterium]
MKSAATWCVVAILIACGAFADVLTPVASYEADETDLTLTRGGADGTLSLDIMTGGAGGVPSATDGTRVLRLRYTGETDRKIEYRHDWTTSTYDLAGNTQLLADVYFADTGSRPTIMGVWSSNWQPPDAWQAAASVPTAVGVWQTVAFNLNGRTQTNLNYLHALVFENLGASVGTIYVDNLRLRGAGGTLVPAGVCANGLAESNEIYWKPLNVQDLNGYHTYRAPAAGGAYERITAAPVGGSSYSDPVGLGADPMLYYVTSVVAGAESPASEIAYAAYDGLTDDDLLDMVQLTAFQYFWNGGHPYCGMAREGLGLGHPLDTVTIGGTGFGLMAIMVGAERGFVTRAQAADRILRIVRFLDGVKPENPSLPSGVQRYHGAWAHHYNGVSGATIPFAGAADNGGDLVETAFLVQGLMTIRQYFDSADPVENEIRTRATSMWQSVEWSWYRRYTGGQVLYWHWSPNYGWQMNLPIRGFNETQIIYLLAIASPTYPMPASSYALGYASLAGYVNGNTYYGCKQWVGEPLGGPLFFTHYSHLGFDPRYRHDAYCNYYDNSRNISRIHRAYSIDNPGSYLGYNALLWGLTASNDPWGYLAHSPTVDNGTISPTAALSATPYVPQESLAALRQMYDRYGTQAFGPYGPYDAFNETAFWVAPGYLAIDQGPIVVMIENYRSGLCWNLFMANPEIAPMLHAIGFRYDVDFDSDGDIDAADGDVFLGAIASPDVLTPPPGVPQPVFDLADLDGDGDVDLADYLIMQRLFTGG